MPTICAILLFAFFTNVFVSCSGDEPRSSVDPRGGKFHECDARIFIYVPKEDVDIVIDGKRGFRLPFEGCIEPGIHQIRFESATLGVREETINVEAGTRYSWIFGRESWATGTWKATPLEHILDVRRRVSEIEEAYSKGRK